MKIIFNSLSWQEYLSWQHQDRKILKKINDLIKDIQRHPFEGKGKPEALKYDLSGYWSRRIEREHRLVYKVDDDSIFIYSCKFHYDK